MQVLNNNNNNNNNKITNNLYTEEQASVTFRGFKGGPYNLLENNI